MSEFKLVKDLGLTVRKLEYLHQPPEYVVSANDLETILAKGISDWVGSSEMPNSNLKERAKRLLEGE